jgi:hypothetical protein
MVKKQITNFFKKYTLSLLVLTIFLFLTVFLISDSNHFFYNLEPYPDGLVYGLSGRNLALNKGFQLVTNYGSSRVWTAPLYQLFLFSGYIFSSRIETAYVLNILLGIFGLCFFIKIIDITIKKLWLKILGIIVYLSHAVIFWLPTLMMSENLSLTTFIAFIYFYLEKNSIKKYFLSILIGMSFFFTKFSLIGVTLGSLVVIGKEYLKFKPKQKKIIFIIFPFLILIFELLLKSREISSLRVFNSIFEKGNIFFSFRFIIPNLIIYTKMLILNKGFFLWLDIGLTNFIFFGLFLTSLFVLFKKKLWQKFWLLIVLFLAQFPLQLVFYVADARYIIYSIPLIVLGVTWLVDALPEKRRILIPLVVLGIFLQLFMQRNLVRQIVADNLLGRSTAWQYEAIKHFNSVLEDDSLIITALPPFLVDTYQEKNYRVLPLSYTQEFMNKKQYVWGDDIHYENIMETYRNWINEGKTIYISNSYITHHQDVVKDFENFKKEFTLKSISNGCENACNIYRLELLIPESNNSSL